MTEFTLDLSNVEDQVNVNGTLSPQPLDPHNVGPLRPAADGGLDPRFLAATVSPRNHHRNSADFTQTPHFLRACALCKRRLIPGRDIYMYRYSLSVICAYTFGDTSYVFFEKTYGCCPDCSKRLHSNTICYSLCDISTRLFMRILQPLASPTADESGREEGEVLVGIPERVRIHGYRTGKRDDHRRVDYNVETCHVYYPLLYVYGFNIHAYACGCMLRLYKCIFP
ncbi:hypothetical protein RJ640_006673 [Escallonia rubra]|uniref:FLZ-type domain-containing protein n=1 Tax=Escallonia rubra TaxID=112253 RepID=A0AA88R7Q1_9ASTE|nr:hypothetical protein RJ640_006673 [Escallonia rubra]